MKRSYGSVGVRPVISNERDADPIVLQLANAPAVDTTAPVPLYPRRRESSRPPSTPASVESLRLADKAHELSRKFAYSGFYMQSTTKQVVAGRRYSDKYRKLAGILAVYDEITEPLPNLFPLELRQRFPKRYKPNSSSEFLSFTDTFSGLVEGARLKNQMRDSAQPSAYGAESGDVEGEDNEEAVERTDKSGESKGLPRDSAGSDNEEEEEEEDEEEEEEEDDAENDDINNVDEEGDYGNNYEDDDEDGNDAFGNDDEDTM